MNIYFRDDLHRPVIRSLIRSAPTDATILGILDHPTTTLPRISRSQRRHHRHRHRQCLHPRLFQCSSAADRQTILEIDPDLATNPALAPASITFNTAGDPVVTLPTATTTATMNRFGLGDIYFVTSQRGGTFAAITKH